MPSWYICRQCEHALSQVEKAALANDKFVKSFLEHRRGNLGGCEQIIALYGVCLGQTSTALTTQESTEIVIQGA